MTKAVFVHDGDVVDYTPASDVAAGDVVLAVELVGVAKHDIPAGRLGALALTGVYRCPKAVGSGKGMVFGEPVGWVAANQNIDKSSVSGAVLFGMVVQAAGDDDPHVLVRLQQNP